MQEYLAALIASTLERMHGIKSSPDKFMLFNRSGYNKDVSKGLKAALKPLRK